MKTKNEKAALTELIGLLETKKAIELKAMKAQFYIAVESVQPINLLKKTFTQVVESPSIKEDLLDNAIGLATGFLSKKILVGGSSHNPIKQVFGSLLQFAIASVVAKHTDSIKSTSKSFFQKLFQHEKKEKPLLD